MAADRHIFNLKDVCQSSKLLAGEDEFTPNEKPELNLKCVVCNTDVANTVQTLSEHQLLWKTNA